MSNARPSRFPAYIGLGSNQQSVAGGPASTIAAAVASFSELGEVEDRSSFYLTDPVGVLDQPVFVNAVVVLRTAFGTEQLLLRLLAIDTVSAGIAPPPDPGGRVLLISTFCSLAAWLFLPNASLYPIPL